MSSACLGAPPERQDAWPLRGRLVNNVCAGRGPGVCSASGDAQGAAGASCLPGGAACAARACPNSGCGPGAFSCHTVACLRSWHTMSLCRSCPCSAAYISARRTGRGGEQCPLCAQAGEEEDPIQDTTQEEAAQAVPQEGAAEGAAQEEEPDQAAPQEEPPAKRKRGRPRKKLKRVYAPEVQPPASSGAHACRQPARYRCDCG